MVNLNVPILRQLVQTYTPEGFYIFQKEWDLQFVVTLTQRDEKGPLYTYIAHMIDDVGEWRVEFKPDTQEISCTCGMFETLEILCCHALKVYELNDVKGMPAQYISKLWTREARNDVAYDDSGSETQVDPELVIQQRYRHLMHKMVRLAAKAAETQESSERVRRFIIELGNKVEDIDKDVPEPSRAPVMESQNIHKGFKRREGRKEKARLKGKRFNDKKMTQREQEGIIDREASSSRKRRKDL